MRAPRDSRERPAKKFHKEPEIPFYASLKYLQAPSALLLAAGCRALPNYEATRRRAEPSRLERRAVVLRVRILLCLDGRLLRAPPNEPGDV